MNKWVVKKNDAGRKEVWAYIDTEAEARRYWYISQAIDKYGLEKVVPLAINDVGGYHPLRWDIENGRIVAIVEQEEKPTLAIDDEYFVNYEPFRSGWLSPLCVSYSCGYMEHEPLAKKLARINYNFDGGAGDDNLLHNEWVKVVHEGWIGVLPKMNNRQVAWLKEHDIPYYFGNDEEVKRLVRGE